MKSPLPQIFGRNLYKVRKCRKLTQEELANLIGMDRCHVQDLEAGRKEVGLKRLVGLCVALNVSTESLLEGRPVVLAEWLHMMASDAKA